MIAIVAIAVGLACAAIYAMWPRPLVSRRTNAHDPAWKPTGYTVKFAGHDQAQGEAGRLASLARQQAQRKAADVIRPPRTRASVTSISAGAGRRRP